MAWYPGKHTKPLDMLPKTNERLAAIKGDLNSEEAQRCLVEFLAANPHFAITLLTGNVDIFEFQDILIRTLFSKDFVIVVASRGLSKSYTAALFALLYAIFNPGIKIGICSASFRQARGIFQQIETWAFHPRGTFLRQCLRDVSHRNDSWEMRFNNESLIVALPLGAGDKIRGYRFNVIMIDELLLLTDKVINEVIQPFLAIQSDPRMRQQVREAEEVLIKAGKLDPKDRIQFPSNKLIGLTSASYKFEYLFQLFSDYKERIFDEGANEVSHALFQLSYNIAPAGLYDQKMIESARKSTSAAQFGREYMAHFSDDSSGYYSAQKMELATIKPGEYPCIKLLGDPGVPCILAIDPNYNDSESSDHFAMTLLEVNEEGRTGAVIHNYALSKSSLKNRGAYIKYLLEGFDIVYVITDAAGGSSFVNDLVDLGVLNKSLRIFEHDFDNENYLEGVMNSRNSYNLESNKIVHVQVFKPSWIRSANESLQAAIEHRKILFAAKLVDENQYNMQMQKKVPIETLEWESEGSEVGKLSGGASKPDFLKAEFIDHQNYLMDLLKREMTLIEINTTSTGHQSFDLPENLRRNKSADRARKDSYTALLLAQWGLKCYLDMKTQKIPPKLAFKPKFLV